MWMCLKSRAVRLHVTLCTGFLCVLGLQTKRRCFLRLCLIIIRGAHLSSAPLLTLFSQHHWSALSRPHWQNCHVHIQNLLSCHQERGLLIWSQRWKPVQGEKTKQKTERLPGEQPAKWNSIKMIVVIKAMKRDSAPYYSVVFVLSPSTMSSHGVFVLWGRSQFSTQLIAAELPASCSLTWCTVVFAPWTEARREHFSLLSLHQHVCAALKRPGSQRCVAQLFANCVV